MGQINWARVFLGGILAGILIFFSGWAIHGVMLKADWQAARESINRPAEEEDMAVIALYGVISLAYGLALAWTYAAIRARFGPGPGTAIKAGFLIWLVGYALPVLDWVPAGVYTDRLLAWTLGGGLVELLVAAMVAGWLYKEAAA